MDNNSIIKRDFTKMLVSIGSLSFGVNVEDNKDKDLKDLDFFSIVLAKPDPDNSRFLINYTLLFDLFDNGSQSLILKRSLFTVWFDNNDLINDVKNDFNNLITLKVVKEYLLDPLPTEETPTLKALSEKEQEKVYKAFLRKVKEKLHLYVKEITIN